MDRFDAMRVFTRIVERRSFTLAADDLGLPRSSVTDAVKGLEARLGVRLLQRTTRQVSPTLDGEAYYRRCLAIIADIEDADAAFTGAKPKGLVRVDVLEEEAAIVARVIDNGHGFTRAEVAKAGVPFRRFDRPGAVTGAGMGLAIAMSLARRMGGAIRLDGSPGGGSVAELRLPKA